MLILTNEYGLEVGSERIVLFDIPILHTGKWESYQDNSGLIELKARNAIYEVHFSADIRAKDGETAQLAIAVDGIPLGEAYMTSIGNNLANVAKTTAVKTNDSRAYISIVNVGSSNVIVHHSALYIKRTA